MTSFGAPTECSTGPLYFFDQPTRRNRIKGTRSNILHFNVANEGAQLEQTVQSNPENDNKEGKSDELTQGLPGETCGDGKPDTSSAVSGALNMRDHDPMDAYKRAAPQLLNELARILSQHKWTEEECLPHGIVNILNYSWQDLTAGAVHLKSPERTDKRRKSKGTLKLDETPRQVSANDKKETGERNAFVGGHVGPPERKTRMKKRKSNYNRAHTSTTISFSISSSSCKDPGWIIQPKQPSCDAPQRMNLCQWVVERLQAARNPVKLETAEQDLNKPLILRHYGDAKAKLKDKRTRSKPATLVNGMPQIPELKQQDPACKKLHYRINDGSSFIYYPSGYMAVCQSHSGLPCGGLYTNVFSDSECPVILATITAFGHGAVTHPLSSAITALWDQDGGFICDHYGSITKEWSWQADRALREKIVIHLSDLITVQLLSGTSAMLSFRCDNESVQLPLSALSNMNPSKETTCLQTDGRFTSDTAQDLLQARKVKSPVVVIESRKNLTLTPVSVCSWEVLQMDRELEGLEGPSAQWRRGGHAGRELKRLQQRARNVLDDWLDYYRVAIGIKCPNTKRMPDAPLRTRLRREVQSAALPSLNPPERADAEPVQPEESRNELQELHRHLSAPAEIPLDSSVKLPRTPKKQTKEESRVTQIGPLQIHGNIKLESVIIPNNPELSGLSVVTCCPAQSSFTPSIPLTVCPPLLRAAILGEGGRRRCCCSTTVMPVVTDLEYDAFVMGQPPHSQQILVVCVTPPRQPINTHSAPDQDALEQLYRRRNKHRTMPCTQCQMDSFRLVRYEMSTGKSSCGVENLLLQHRHNAAPGMILVSKPTAVLAKGCILCPLHVFMDPTGWQQCLPEAREVIAVGGWAEEDYCKVLSFPRNPDIYYKGPKVLLRDHRAAITVDRILCTHTMYIRGKLLFVGYIFSSQSCSVRDLQKQISRTRGDYRLGLSLPSDYKFSDTVNKPSATDSHNSQDATLTGGDDTTLTASVEIEKANDTRNNQVPELSHQRQRDFCVKPKKTPVFPHVPVIMH